MQADFGEPFLPASAASRNRKVRLCVPPGAISDALPVPIDLADTAQAVADQFARRPLHRRLLPETECNDALILAETSLANVPLLTSSDHHLLDIDEASLLIVFNAADLLPVRVMHPQRWLKARR